MRSTHELVFSALAFCYLLCLNCTLTPLCTVLGASRLSSRHVHMLC